MGNSDTEGPPKELSVDLGGGVKIDLVLIPAGSFMMGDEGDGPAHKVTITKPFYLGKYEVTQEQWQAVMGRNPNRPEVLKAPVVTVSWEDCQTFLGKLNAKIGEEGSTFALPTEAQWEYACRAGSTTQYCFGDDEDRLQEYAWYRANSEHKPHPVGEKKPNAWGLYDMHGNVWEWCADWYDRGYYANSPADDPTGPVGGSSRVYRGGSWGSIADYCRSASRGRTVPAYHDDLVGLRVARVPADK